MKVHLNGLLIILTLTASFSTATTWPGANAAETKMQGPDSRLRRARKLFENGHTMEARALTKSLCNSPGRTAEMYCLLAETYIYDERERAADSAEALRCLAMALKLDPNCSQAYKSLAEYSNNLGDYKKALAYCDKGLSLPNPIVYIWRQRALANANLGHYEQALIDIEPVLKHLKKDSSALELKASLLKNLKRYDQAAAVYRQAFAMHPRDQTMFDITRCLESAHKYPEAIAEISQLIKINSQDSEAYALRAKLEVCCHREKEALADYTQAISLESSARLYRERAGLYKLLGQTPNSQADLAAA